jgi:hypothetical protein
MHFRWAVREAQRARPGEQHGQREVVGQASRAMDLDRPIDDPLRRRGYRDLDF